MANGTPGPPGGWVDSAVKVVTQLGFPIVVAGVLLWYLLTRFEHNMETVTLRMAQNGEAARLLVAEQDKQLVSQDRQYTELQAQTKALQELVVALRQLMQQRGATP